MAEYHGYDDRARVCDCGSGLQDYAIFDAQNIYLCRTCPMCHDEKMSHYRPEILTGYDQSDVDEPIEPEDY